MTARAELWKRLVGQVSSLSHERVKTVVSVPMPGDGEPNTSLATLYAELADRCPNPIAVRLESELLGTRQLVATANVPPGFAGVVAIATGIIADQWHGTAHGVLDSATLTLKLGVRPCCSGHRVVVPPNLTTQLTPRLKALQPTAHLPLNRAEGSYNVVDGTAGQVQLSAAERVLRIVAIADPLGAGGTLSGVGMSPLAFDAGQVVEYQPRGNLTGPRTLTFAGTTYFQVELVN